MPSLRIGLCSSLLLVHVVGCSPVESHRTLEPQSLAGTVRPQFALEPVIIGEFVNRSTYMNGLFADSRDALGSQAQAILTTHLAQSGGFAVLDRVNMAAADREAAYRNTTRKVAGARAIVTGAVTEFGRRETGTRTLGGLISKSKTQVLYTKVSLSVVDVDTSAVKASFQGAGEYELTNSEILGTGGTAGYDSTLADKVLNLAIMEAVSRMIEAKNAKQW